MRVLTYGWAQSIETLLEPEQETLARLIAAEARVPPYIRDERKAVHVALKELQEYLQARANELLEAQAVHLNEGKKKRNSQGPSLVLGHTWKAAIREGLLLFPKHKAHALRVTLRGWERALNLADDLFTMASLRGYEPVPWKMWDKTFKIRAVEAELDLRIMEKLARVQDDGEGSATGTPYENYFTTTRSLSIYLNRAGGEVEVVEKEGVPLEDQLEELFDQIPRELVLDLAQNRKWQRDKEADAEARQAELELKRLKDAEAARRSRLEDEAQNWHRAIMIRQYAEEIERAMLPDMGDAAKEWVKWARTVADEVDPTSKRCNQLRHTAGMTSPDGKEDASASNNTARGAIRQGMESPDFEALPRVWPLRQWTA
ncbi:MULTISPECIES: hypothetical protein [Achromobacter]|uniref:Uncharacterized protein n=1 Tax=Achromobacter agilis TaxID=1353888 RepID=A0A446CKT0_9BURK|nr:MULTISPECIES: hypothetical protein [Achromobacter]KGD95224.1 hypothetical protein JL37_11030 [Achromobacter sp. RTa]SSW68536.1 hypothetical protein AGI3411_03728 [Achromobacter agilis]